MNTPLPELPRMPELPKTTRHFGIDLAKSTPQHTDTIAQEIATRWGATVLQTSLPTV